MLTRAADTDNTDSRLPARRKVGLNLPNLMSLGRTPTLFMTHDIARDGRKSALG